MWSDNYAGQLKNRMLLFLYMFLVTNGFFHTIDHKFLIPGHSFSSLDCDFALIEKHTIHCKLQTVEDIKTAIVTARPSQPFKVLDMGNKNFFDFDHVSSKYIDTSKLGISKATWLQITRDLTGVVFYKTNYSDIACWEKCCVMKAGITENHIKTATLPSLNDEIPLSELKKRDLIKMLDFMSEETKQYFSRILSV